LSQACSPRCIRLQVSDCSAFRIMCDVAKYSCLCSESNWVVSKFFFKPLLVLRFSIYYRCNHTFNIPHGLLYLSFFSASFCVIFLSDGIATSVSMRVSSFQALSQNCEKRLLASSCLSVRPSSWNNSTAAGRMFMNTYIWDFTMDYRLARYACTGVDTWLVHNAGAVTPAMLPVGWVSPSSRSKSKLYDK
jgi:hypothetical protein